MSVCENGVLTRQRALESHTATTMTSLSMTSRARNRDVPRPPTLHREPHGTLATARHYVGDLVYGANDGLITTFAVVAGVAGGALSSRATLIIGAANLFADGLSMAVGNYLSIRSREGALAAQNLPEEEAHPARHGLATLLAFVAAGGVPLLPFTISIGAQPDRVDRPDVHDVVRHRRVAGGRDDRPVVAGGPRNAASRHSRKPRRVWKRRGRRMAARRGLMSGSCRQLAHLVFFGRIAANDFPIA